LFSVLMIAGYLFASLTQQHHALVGRHALQAFLFVVLAIYFVWFWSHGGQTVAMKAWHIRVVDRRLAPLSQPRALLRYLLSWLWFAPALLALQWAEIRSPPGIALLLISGIVSYAMLTWLHPQRQFLHDALSGTCLITQRPVPAPR
jgi:uncharacterized RDD family membrane protein YckC